MFSLALSGVLHAEGADTSTLEARKRFREGVAAADAGRFDAARVAFQQAYSLKANPVVARNLAEAELRTGRPVEAARHLEIYLREAREAPSADIEAARQSLREAEDKVARVIVEVEPKTAETYVDGDRIASGQVWYMTPGSHVVLAKNHGYADSSELRTFDSGKLESVNFWLRALPGSAATAATTMAASSRSPSEPTFGSGGDTAAKTAVVLSGGAMTAFALGIGVVYAIRAGLATSDAGVLTDSIRAEKGDPNRGTGIGCAGGGTRCDELSQALDRHHGARSVSNAGFVGAAILGGATLATYLLWRPKAATASIRLEPRASYDSGSLSISGAF